MPPRKHRVLITNPQPIGGKPDMVVKGVVAKGYIIVPIEAGLFEVYMGNKYLGEAEGDAQIRKLIERDGASAPVLIQNPNGGYEMYSYTRPTGNPKKKRKKAAKKKKKATKRKTPRKAKKAAKKRPAKKRKKKSVKRKKNAKRKAPRKAKKKASKKVSPRKKKRISKAKKKVKSAKKAVRKAKKALSKAKRSPNPTANPRKKKRKSSKKKASHAPRHKATLGDINAYVKRVTGKKF
jgi:hypothetical protein